MSQVDYKCTNVTSGQPVCQSVAHLFVWWWVIYERMRPGVTCWPGFDLMWSMVCLSGITGHLYTELTELRLWRHALYNETDTSCCRRILSWHLFYRDYSIHVSVLSWLFNLYVDYLHRCILHYNDYS